MSVFPDCRSLSSCQVLFLLSQMEWANILLCCRLSELSLSLKLSHHQFITSVGVAEVTIKTTIDQSTSVISTEVLLYICQKPIFSEKGLISETNSIRYLTDLSKLQMGVSILHSNVCLSGIRILP